MQADDGLGVLKTTRRVMNRISVGRLDVCEFFYVLYTHKYIKSTDTV